MYSDSELKAVVLKDFQKTLRRYTHLIEIKSYKNFQSRKYTDKIQNLDNQIEYELSQIEVGIVENVEGLFTKIKEGQLHEYISKNEDLIYFKNQISEIFISLMDYNYILNAEMITDIEKQWFPHWILPTSTFDFNSFIQILQNAKAESLTLDQVLIDKLMLKSRILETLDFWRNNEKVFHRIPILEEAVKAHLEGNFYLSVSTMIPQVEGLLRDAIEISDIRNANFYSMEPNHMRSATESLKKEWKKKTEDNNGLLVLLENFPDVIGNLYQEYKLESAIKNGLYRHGVCHGLQTDFGTEKNSLLLILIIDRIIFFM